MQIPPGHLFFLSKIDIDRSIFSIIDFEKIVQYSLVRYHFGSIFGHENESGIIFFQIDIDRSIYRFSIDRCMDFESIFDRSMYRF